MTDVYLGLGSNLGDKADHLRTAIRLIGERIGKVASLSSFYETEPWGFVSDNSFLNAAVRVETALPPFEVLRITQQIEREMGRDRKSADGVYSDRPIDIDLLLYGSLVLSTPQLTVPHPLMTERDFVMTPLAEIAGDFRHPVSGKRLREFLPSRKTGKISRDIG